MSTPTSEPTTPPIAKGIVVAGCSAMLSVTIAAAPQFTTWTDAESIGAAVNTTGIDAGGFVTRDGLSLYLTSDRPGGSGGLDLWVAQRPSIDEPWESPRNLGPTVNGPGNDVTPTVSDDGHSLFFASARPGSLGHGDIYVSHRVHTRDDFAWQPPIHLGVSINSAANEIGPSFVTRTRTLYFSVDAPAAPGEIMASELQPDGTFSVPLPVHEVNSSSDELRPTVRRDGLEMYFDSNRPGGLGGTDIWVATRDSVHDPWRTPVNAGPAINSAASEARAALSFDRLGLIFQSTRSGGSGGVDLYSSTRRLYAPRRSATAP